MDLTNSASAEPGPSARRNLDAFNDILHGGFGTPEEGFLLRWSNHELSRARLGPTLFDELREIIDGHPTGFPPRGRVELVLAQAASLRRHSRRWPSLAVFR